MDTFLGHFGRPVGSERGRSHTCRAALYFGTGARWPSASRVEETFDDE